ncbi:accessory gene regulator B family protein [Paenibacillus tritici]|uniref:Accessory gene regulator B family protein n=1 Tax=Paenibacillus tritici TaxID=1873425 RepID=A0ABX2DGN7_9BACL|nr:accessory gene regulator B family protein [Paenibacillus tritici]NQX43782.1 accessory gene regulator B family protein [Paenibacillus tritici]
MIEQMAVKLARGIKQRSPEHPATVAVLTHSLAILINTFSILALTMVLGILTDHLHETFVVLVSFAALRMVSGGMHLRSGTFCVIVTTVMVLIVSHVEITVNWTWGVTAISFLIAARFAPTDIQKQSRIPRKYYPVLKILSIILISMNFLLGSSVVAASFLVQTLLLIPWKEVGNR